jgi:peroxiredoxin Q/BCP
MLQVGNKAPDLTLPDQGGAPRRLSELWAKGPIVVYFYPKDETPGCTAEACAFRDAYQTFTDVGAEVVGISADSSRSHASFASHHRLPFVLLSDRDGAARRQFEVKRTLGLFAGRVTYVIDTAGTIRHAFDSQIRPTAHVGEALDVVKQLVGERGATSSW